MGKSPVDIINKFLEALVDQQPEPPRIVQFWDVLLFILRLIPFMITSIVAVGIFAAVFAMGVIGTMGVTHINDHTIFVVMASLLALYMLLLPILIAISVYKRARFGIRAEAEVISAKHSEPVFTHSFDDVNNGVVTGTLIAHVNGQPFEHRYRINRPWARSVRQGSRIEVLAGPKPKNIVPLRLLKE